MTTTTTTAAPVDPLVGKTLGQSESLSNWVGPYVTNMLGQTQALAQQPYQVYQGPLTAGASPLQQQAFQGIGGLQTPTSMTSAASTAGGIAQQAGGMAYSPTTFGNQFAAPGAYGTAQFDAGYKPPSAYQSTTDFSSQFVAPGAYDPTKFETGIWSTQAAQQYMNPFLQQALTPQLQDLTRQADIARLSDAARLGQAGAYGGSRQAIMEAENRRNLLGKQSDVLAQGYKTAYDVGQQAFMTDQQRALAAQQATEASRQFGAQQGMTAAQLAAQYGLLGKQAEEASRQFGYGQAMTAADVASQRALQAQQAAEQSKQFGATQGMTAAQLAAQYGLGAQQAQEASKQFGASYGLDALSRQLQAAQAQGALGQAELKAQQDIYNQLAQAGAAQRAIEGEGITADYNEFLQQRDYPMKMLQFQQSMLQGLPIQSVSNNIQQPSTLSSILGGTSGILSLLQTAGFLPKQ